MSDLDVSAEIMKSYLKYALTLALVSAIGCKSTSVSGSREITISGGERISAHFLGGIPVPAESSAGKIEVAGLLVGDGYLIYTFGLVASMPLGFVRIEDVTGVFPVLLLTDETPELDKDYWIGNSAPIRISEERTPWLYEDGDTIKVFKFTLKTIGDEPPIIMYQPSVFASQAKMALSAMANDRR